MEDRLDVQDLGYSKKISMYKFSNHQCCPKREWAVWGEKKVLPQCVLSR